MKHLLLSIALLLGAPAIPQPGFIELQPVYGMTQANASQTLTQAGLTEAQAQTKFKSYWARWVWEGKSAAAFMQQGYAVCCALDAFWLGHMHAISSSPAGSGNIQIGPVNFTVTDRMWWPLGRIEGVGTATDKRYNTNITVDHANWKGDPKLRNIIMSPTYGGNGAMAYHESAKATNLSLNGNKPGPYCDPSFSSSGLVCWDLGEGSHVGDIRANDFNDYGVLIERGTPADFDNITAFRNGRAAIGLIGTALATIQVEKLNCDDESDDYQVELLSGDDNCTLVEMLPGHGREAGGNVHFGTIKCESSTTGEGVWGVNHVYKGQSVGHFRGQFNVVIDALSYASTWTTTGQLFWVDDRLLNGTPQASKIVVQGAKGYGYAALLVDSRRGQYYDAPPNYSTWSMEYNTSTGVMLVNGVVQTPKPCLKNMGPIGFVRQGQSINWLAGTPQQQVTGSAPPPPTPVTCTGWTTGNWSAWGACMGGTQKRTRSVTADPPGCTVLPPGTKPQEEETQTCTPPTTVTLFDGQASITSASQAHVLSPAWTNAKSITVTGLLAPTLGGLICSAGDRGLKIGTNGSVYISIFNVGNINLLPAGTVKANTASSFTVTLTQPITFTHLGTAPGRGDALKCTITKMLVKQ